MSSSGDGLPLTSNKVNTLNLPWSLLTWDGAKECRDEDFPEHFRNDWVLPPIRTLTHCQLETIQNIHMHSSQMICIARVWELHNEPTCGVNPLKTKTRNVYSSVLQSKCQALAMTYWSWQFNFMGQFHRIRPQEPSHQPPTKNLNQVFKANLKRQH